jgi:hypothetical protein
LHYAGWDRTATPAQNATGIHHPKGDAMKISPEEHAVFAQNHPITGAFLSTWRVDHFEQGTLQPGSSGSPLFNQDHRIVGQLSTAPSVNDNNSSACVSTNRNGNYGRFDMSWTGGGTNATRLSDWLDPLTTAPFTLNGIGGGIIGGPDIIGATCSATYTISTPSSGVTGHTWSVIGGGLTFIPGSNTSPSFTVGRTANVNDPILSTIQCSFIFNGQTYTATKTIIARIEPVFEGMRESALSPLIIAARVGYPVYFQAGLPNDQRLFVLEYQWDLIDGGLTYHFDGELTTSSHTFITAGTYLLRQRVRDGCGWSRWIDIYVEAM